MTLRYVYALAALLTAIGLSIFVYKWQVLGFPVTENQKTPIWTIETAIRFDRGPGSIKANLQIPTLTPGFRTLREYNVSKGFGFSLNYVSGGREAQWAVRRSAGAQTLFGAAMCLISLHLLREPAIHTSLEDFQWERTSAQQLVVKCADIEIVAQSLFGLSAQAEYL